MKTKENSPANHANPREYSPAESQGRDGSPQPSLDSTASQASRRSAPTFFPLRASALIRTIRGQKLTLFSGFKECGRPAHWFGTMWARRATLLETAHPRLKFGPTQRSAHQGFAAIRGSSFPVSALRSPVSSSAFTLLEVLVATAVLALMMTFLFNLLGSSAKLWEIGNKKMEAAQAARVGLNIMANDLKNAFAGKMTSYSSNGSAVYNLAPFLGLDSSNSNITGTLTGDASVAAGSDQLFGVRLTSDSSNPYEQFGYQCIYVTTTGGFDNMKDKRYYLVGQNISDAFYYRGSSPSSTWYNNTANSQNLPIVDNCIRVKFSYYGNQTSLTDQITANGTRSFTSNGTWSANATTSHLPLGVLVTISVIDSKTAEKIAAINGNSALTDTQITNGLSSSPPATLSPVERLISQGSVTMSRFIPFNAN